MLINNLEIFCAPWLWCRQGGTMNVWGLGSGLGCQHLSSKTVNNQDQRQSKCFQNVDGHFHCHLQEMRTTDVSMMQTCFTVLKMFPTKKGLTSFQEDSTVHLEWHHITRDYFSRFTKLRQLNITLKIWNARWQLLAHVKNLTFFIEKKIKIPSDYHITKKWMEKECNNSKLDPITQVFLNCLKT